MVPAIVELYLSNNKVASNGDNVVQARGDCIKMMIMLPKTVGDSSKIGDCCRLFCSKDDSMLLCDVLIFADAMIFCNKFAR